MKKLFLKLIITFLFFPLVAFAASTSVDKAEVEGIVKQYLQDNPKVVFDALMAYRSQEMQKMENQSKQTVTDNFDALFKDTKSPVLGSKDAKVTVVEFMDYQCGHCRVMGPRLDTFVDKGDVKVIVRLLPIRGQSSLYATKLAIAAKQQGKFKDAHNALMKAKDISTEAKVDEVLVAAGVNVEEAKKLMPQAQKEVDENFAIATKLKLQGTPALIFASDSPNNAVFIPGAIDSDQLKSIIASFNG